MFFFCYRVFALESIVINDESLSPSFDKRIHLYNYYTNLNEINIKVLGSDGEIITGDGLFSLDSNVNEFIINSNIDGDYKIVVFYKYNDIEDSGINILIDGYEINFNPNVYEYYNNIFDEKFLNINVDLFNSSEKYSIIGNGNFNKSDNIILIKYGDKTYKIHALKSISVSYEVEDEVRVLSENKKEIVILLIIAISSSLIIGFYYIVFKDKTIIRI